MFTPDPTDLIAEYLFEEPQTDGTVVNTANPGTLDGTIIHNVGQFPLNAVDDAPPGFPGGKSLDYNVLRTAGSPSNVSRGDEQLVRVRNFPDPTDDSLTIECWVKVDYFPSSSYPNGQAGFGACPQPLCKECSWYLFLGTLQTDRNLIFTHIPGVQAGLPKPDVSDGAPNLEVCADGPPAPDLVVPCQGVVVQSGSGGTMSERRVERDKWTHIAATFRNTGIGDMPFVMTLYINGEPQDIITAQPNRCGGPAFQYRRNTNNPMHKPGLTNLHLGMFRQILDDLDYQFSGKLCGVRIYERALTDDEICADIAADTSAPDVTLLTPSIVFRDIPEDQEIAAAAVFRVFSPCQRVTLRITGGPTVTVGPGSFDTPLGIVTDVPPSYELDSTAEARIWISHTGTSDNDVTEGTVTVVVVETGQVFDVPITANTVARRTAVIAMALDKSNSMNFESGVGEPLEKRIDVLHFALPPFVELLESINSVGVVAFDHDPHPVLPVTPADPAGRATLNAAFLGHNPNPQGNTAIGDGLEAAHLLVEPETGFDKKAVIILTDGHETAGKYIADVQDLINEQVFAVGLGTAEQIQPNALFALTKDRDGYVLMTGALTVDDAFRLSKYYLQILAGVTNTDIVIDPEGRIRPGQKHWIPFVLNDADISSDVILLTSNADTIRMVVETPAGDTIDPSVVGPLPGADFTVGKNVSFYRLGLPVPIGTGAGADAGTWNAVLTVDDKHYKRYLESLKKYPKVIHELQTHGLPYSLNVHAYSNLRLRAHLTQDSNEPGANLSVRARLTQFGLPLENRATVHAEIERPDGTDAVLSLQEIEPGIFEANTVAAQAGVYRFRLVAQGYTFRNRAFTREQIQTGAVWAGGNDTPPLSDDNRPGDICDILECLLHEKTISKDLEKRILNLGLDLKVLRKCVRLICAAGKS